MNHGQTMLNNRVPSDNVLVDDGLNHETDMPSSKSLFYHKRKAAKLSLENIKYDSD